MILEKFFGVMKIDEFNEFIKIKNDPEFLFKRNNEEMMKSDYVLVLFVVSENKKKEKICCISMEMSFVPDNSFNKDRQTYGFWTCNYLKFFDFDFDFYQYLIDYKCFEKINAEYIKLWNSRVGGQLLMNYTRLNARNIIQKRENTLYNLDIDIQYRNLLMEIEIEKDIVLQNMELRNKLKSIHQNYIKELEIKNDIIKKIEAIS